ncbi:alpha-amylase/4-alpha-glucanotransferase domain-containing protein [Breznakiella homolactica]|uniref:DUF1926 domain-containing protein n=1 Tax=Breznakiella homolactica TaxID=2798577 RepID=A0A7T8B7V8_9SPIR|nr:alpha-amylase/4-alpha-glucanotransferase domain-containing protein [Breznakiella homolactica]QQO07954.1 DUF1926 domain-containing protein [Breznakiella homolactica]
MNSDKKIMLGTHCHVPYGSADEEFESVYEKKLKPFITTLYKFPEIPAMVHYSGVLLNWIERHRPEFFMLLEDLISRKQVELLGGGFYEPLMSFLPLSDKIGQIEMLTTYLRKQFGKRPQGCWLPALSWEQNMVSPLNTSGMAYTFLDEEQFLLAGFTGPGLEYPCTSEDQGKLITVFPVSGRYSGEFALKEPAAVLEKIGSEGLKTQERIITVFPDSFYGADSEKGGEELGVYRFFEELSQWSGRMQFTSPGRILKGLPPLEKGFFPNSADRRFSYWTMGLKNAKKIKDPGESEGDIPYSRSPSFYPGSMPKNCLAKYPEANGIYSKMLYTAGLINQLRGDKSRKRIAREELWKSQGYDVFCHIGDGGIYNNLIRKAAYRALITAERITREKGTFIPSLAAVDFDLDGEKEYLFQNKTINCYVKPRGAAVFELDYLPKTWNYLDTFARRPEPYVQDPGPEDGYRRSAFLDRLCPADAVPGDLAAGVYTGCRCCSEETYDLLHMDRLRQEARFRLSRNNKGPFGSVEIEKLYRLKKDTLSILYTFTNTGEKPETFTFTSEIDLSFYGEGSNLQRVFLIKGEGKEPAAGDSREYRDIAGIEFQDVKNETILHFNSDGNFNCFIMPVRTRCRIGGVIGDYYQSTCVLPLKRVSLEPGESWNTAYSLRIQH